MANIDLTQKTSKTAKFWNFLYYATPGLGFIGITGLIRGLRKLTGFAVGLLAFQAPYWHNADDKKLPFLQRIANIFYPKLSKKNDDEIVNSLKEEYKNTHLYLKLTDSGREIEISKKLLAKLKEGINLLRSDNSVEQYEIKDFMPTLAELRFQKTENPDAEMHIEYTYRFGTSALTDGLQPLTKTNIDQILNFSDVDLQALQKLRNITEEKTSYKLDRKTALSGKTLKAETPLIEKEDIDVFCFGGAGENINYSTPAIREYIIAAKEKNLNLTVHAINPRGVAKSTGYAYPAKDIINDYHRIVMHRIQQIAEEKKIPLKRAATHIALKGNSLGAGFATILAARLHKEGYPVFIDNHASFSSLHKAVGPLPYLPKPLRALLCLIVRFAGWHLPAADAYNSIPGCYKGHIVRKAKSQKTSPSLSWKAIFGLIGPQSDSANSDGVIPFKGSLNNALKEGRTTEKNAIKIIIEHLKYLEENASKKEETLGDYYKNKNKFPYKNLKGIITEIMRDRKKIENLCELHLGERPNIEETKIEDLAWL